MLIDGGRSKARIRDRLTSLGITDLDAILATHADADHIAGLIEAFAMFDVESYVRRSLVLVQPARQPVFLRTTEMTPDPCLPSFFSSPPVPLIPTSQP